MAKRTISLDAALASTMGAHAAAAIDPEKPAPPVEKRTRKKVANGNAPEGEERTYREGKEAITVWFEKGTRDRFRSLAFHRRDGIETMQGHFDRAIGMYLDHMGEAQTTKRR